MAAGHKLLRISCPHGEGYLRAKFKLVNTVAVSVIFRTGHFEVGRTYELRQWHGDPAALGSVVSETRSTC